MDEFLVGLVALPTLVDRLGAFGSQTNQGHKCHPREGIRQIEGRALRKVHLPARSQKLRDYLESVSYTHLTLPTICSV